MTEIPLYRFYIVSVLERQNSESVPEVMHTAFRGADLFGEFFVCLPIFPKASSFTANP